MSRYSLDHGSTFPRLLCFTSHCLPFFLSPASSMVIMAVVVSVVYVQQIHNLGTGQCVDSAAKPDDNHKPVGLWPCHGQGGNQVSLFQVLEHFFCFFFIGFLKVSTYSCFNFSLGACAAGTMKQVKCHVLAT